MTDQQDPARLYPLLDAQGVTWLKEVGAALEEGRIPYVWAPTSAGLTWSVPLLGCVYKCTALVSRAHSVAAADGRPRRVHLAVGDHDPRRLRFGIFVAGDADAGTPPPAGTSETPSMTTRPAVGTPAVAAQTVDDIGRLYPWLSAADLVKASALHDALVDVPHAWAARVADGPLVCVECFSNRDADATVALVRQRQNEWPPAHRSQPVILTMAVVADRAHGRQQAALLFGPAGEAAGAHPVLSDQGTDLARLYPFLDADDLLALYALDTAVDNVPHRWVEPTHPEPASGSRPIAIDTKVADEWLESVCRDATDNLGRPCRVVLTIRSAMGLVRFWTEPIDDDDNDDNTGQVDRKPDAADAKKSTHVDNSVEPLTPSTAVDGDVDIAVPAEFKALGRLPLQGDEVAWVCALTHGLGDVPVAWTQRRLARDIVLDMLTPAERAAEVVNATYHHGRRANDAGPARVVLGVDRTASDRPLFFYRIEVNAQTA
ncbi:hypothetical protein pdul_cds_982 [Pandoravirus dulcis]|uniref:DUF5860 domain-containing protein n=1 Tax=Pandoravirus dulcis TaxID=1349409 RepID=S4VUZ4_9VIRU|nr:hypothetical protein pdul_cds_982 [Pandoravirus dulcis]AGO83240.1 hypothetical protein pdul_cds_982 [Pandoravirus dulcis]